MRIHCWIAALLIVLGTVPALGQSRTAPVNPDAWNTKLEIGPVAGLSTAWHPSPRFTGFPLGETARLRVKGVPSSTVRWQGARAISGNVGEAVAEVRFDAPGRHQVSVEIDRRGEILTETVTFDVVDLGGQAVQVSGLELSADKILLDPENPNASSMQYFFRNGSIAALTEEAPGHWVTSTKRWVTAHAQVEPVALAPLLEWRLNGVPQRHLGSQVELQVFPAREHVLAAGDQEVILETYRVRIISHDDRTDIADGVPVTFTAETQPPGYEDRITWLGSTKFGTCTPPLGQGPELTMTFEGTQGLEQRWVGVKADNAVVGDDAKGKIPDVLMVLPAQVVDSTIGLLIEQGNCDTAIQVTYDGEFTMQDWSLEMQGESEGINLDILHSGTIDLINGTGRFTGSGELQGQTYHGRGEITFSEDQGVFLAREVVELGSESDFDWTANWTLRNGDRGDKVQGGSVITAGISPRAKSWVGPTFWETVETPFGTFQIHRLTNTWLKAPDYRGCFLLIEEEGEEIDGSLQFAGVATLQPEGPPPVP